MADLPIVCALTPAALHARRENLLGVLTARATERVELPDGLRLRFAAGADLLALVARVIEAERECCRFLRFVLVVEPDEGPFTLDLTGPAGTREFVAALFDPS
jgi:hypothetical protein